MNSDPLDLWKKQLTPRKPILSHYYGDVVRGLFIFAGILILALAPYRPELVPAGSFIVVVMVLGVALLAGITNPRQRFIILLDTIVSALGLILFEFFAFAHYRISKSLDSTLIAQEILALIFFFALYYSVKSLRAKLLSQTP